MSSPNLSFLGPSILNTKKSKAHFSLKNYASTANQKQNYCLFPTSNKCFVKLLSNNSEIFEKKDQAKYSLD